MRGVLFEEGTSVIVIEAEGSETFELGADDEAALIAVIPEANRSEIVDGRELLAKLGPHDWRVGSRSKSRKVRLSRSPKSPKGART